MVEPAGATLAAERCLRVDPDLFKRDFDRHTFAFEHRFAGHPLFAPERLMLLAKRMAEDPRDVYCDAGDVGIGQRWEEIGVSAIPPDELLQRIETAGAWIVLRRAEKDPEYAALLDACMSEIQELAGSRLAEQMKLRNAIIFITSPHRISTYHIDRECNFLLHVAGSKTLSVFDRFDRDVLPESEIERFWTTDNNAAVYKPQYQERATTYELLPGQAVHIPVNSPHWVRNGPEVAVSISINFHYHDAALADVYRANYWMRRAGLRPQPPERGADGLKRAAVASARGFNTARRRLLGKT